MSRARFFGALVAVAGVAVGGCSSSDASGDGSSTDASSESGLCSSADALRSSIGALADVPVAEGGAAALRGAVTEVRDDVGRLGDEARDEFSDQVAGVESSADELGAAIGSLGGAPSAAALGAVGTAARSLVEEAGVLLDDVSASC